jgi:hypothetical protein
VPVPLPSLMYPSCTTRPWGQFVNAHCGRLHVLAAIFKHPAILQIWFFFCITYAIEIWHHVQISHHWIMCILCMLRFKHIQSAKNGCLTPKNNRRNIQTPQPRHGPHSAQVGGTALRWCWCCPLGRCHRLRARCRDPGWMWHELKNFERNIC